MKKKMFTIGVTVLATLSLVACLAGCAEKNTKYYLDGDKNSSSYIEIVNSDQHKCKINDLNLGRGLNKVDRFNGIELNYDSTDCGSYYTFTIKAKKAEDARYSYYSGEKRDSEITLDTYNTKYKK